MEEIKRKLVESGVIGRVVDDFNPRLGVIVFYGDKEISLGDEVTLAEVQRNPTYFECYRDALDVELEETFANPELAALVVTGPDAAGGEYLHWLFAPGRHQGSPLMELAAYEPPRSGAHMLVFTLFKADGFQSISVPNSRENFSTRTFAHTNALGSPLGASFFKIKYENEDEKQKNESNGSSAWINAGSCSKPQENGSTSNSCISAGSCNKRQENGSTSNPKHIPESTSKRMIISVSLGADFSSIKYENEDENRKKD